MPTDSAIAPGDTVNDVLQRHPTTVAVLNTFGVDTCCGGALSLAEAAKADGIDLDRLLDALSDAIRSERATA